MLKENFVYFTTSPILIDRLFGPIEREHEIPYLYDDDFHLEHLVCYLGVFPSLSQARKNNWGGEIPRGYHKHRVGKTFFWTYRSSLDIYPSREQCMQINSLDNPFQ